VKVRKKPVVVDAVLYTGNNGDEIATFMQFNPGHFHGGAVLKIPTLEGVMAADPGDYIIKGVKGEFYPCKPDVFAQTYEVVE
jgi:hypothetical protein